MQFEDKDFALQHGDKRPVPATSASLPFAAPAPVRPTEQRDREKLAAAAVNNSSLAGHRYTNHDRTSMQPPSASLSIAGNVPSSKTAAQASEETLRLPSAAVDTALNQPPLRRIKTESGALSMSTKQYFQRRERERLERDAVKTELTADVKPAVNDGSSNHNVSSGQNILLKGQHENLPLSVNKGLGTGDPSDQRPANIFESFCINDSQQADGSVESKAVTTTYASSVSDSRQADGVTSVSAADNLDLVAILKPEHVHGGSYSLELPVFTTAAVAGASSAAVITVQCETSSTSSVSCEHHGAHSDRSQQRGHTEHSPERRRSARHEGSVSLLSPTKPQHTHRTDQTSASDVSETSRRTRLSKSSQPSPLKMKLSLLSGASRSGSPSSVKHAGETSMSPKLKSHVSSPLLESQTLSTSDSQEHIRLKLNVSSGRVEKLSNAAASPSPASGMKLVLSKDKVSGEYQHGASSSSSSETRHRHHHHHRHHHEHDQHQHRHHRHHRHSRPGEDGHSAHVRKRPADVDSAAKPSMEKKLRAELSGNGHQSSTTRRLSQPQPSQTNNVAIGSGLSRTHIPSTYRVSGLSSAVPPPPPPPLPPLPAEELAAPPPPPLPPQ